MVAFRLDLQVGDFVEQRFRIVKCIGQGSYGDVFLVEDGHGKYAMKILRLYDEPGELHDNLVRYFKQEYETAKMPGDNFIHSLEFSKTKGNPFFTMEYCANGDLAKYVGKNTALLPQLAHDILVGLHDLHSSGRIHRDLKPENVLIRDNGHAALTDFGSIGNMNARQRLSTKSLFGRPKMRFGSPLYMASEMQDLKGGGVTYLPTIDIFSFGVMMYELLTFGKFPFGNPKSVAELPIYQENVRKNRWSRQILREAPYGRDWLPIIEKCLEARYQDRYQNVRSIIHDVEPLIGSSYQRQVLGQMSRTPHISRIVITQGDDIGRVFNLNQMLAGKGAMLRIGRSSHNDIVLRDNIDTYVSRNHFTLERSATSNYWVIRDGQWNIDAHEWVHSTNGTYLNASPVGKNGLKVFTGDIITAGEYKLKIE